MLRRIDADGDGDITLEEFREWWLSPDRPLLNATHKLRLVRMLARARQEKWHRHAAAVAAAVEGLRRRAGGDASRPPRPPMAMAPEGGGAGPLRFPGSILSAEVSARWRRLVADHPANAEKEAGLQHFGLEDQASWAERLQLVAPGHHGMGAPAAGSAGLRASLSVSLQDWRLWTLAEDRLVSAATVCAATLPCRLTPSAARPQLHAALGAGPLPLTTAQATECCRRRGLSVRDGDAVVLLAAWVGLTAAPAVGEKAAPVCPLLLGLLLHANGGGTAGGQTAESVLEAITDGIAQGMDAS